MSTVALKIEDLPHYTYDDYIQWEGQWEIIRGLSTYLLLFIVRQKIDIII